MPLSSPQSTQRILLGALTLITLGLILCGSSIWGISDQLRVLEKTLATTESFVRIERQIQLELEKGAGGTQTERARPNQADIGRLLDVVREEDSRMATTRTKIAALRERVRQALILEAIMTLLLMATATLLWRATFRPLKRVMDVLPGLLTLPDVRQPHTGPASKIASLSLEEIADRAERSFNEKAAERSSIQPETDTLARSLLEEQLSLSSEEKKIIASELSASIAHDIRNPLAAIQMSLSNLRADLEDEELAERAERISAEVIRMSGILTESVDSTRLEPEPAALIQLADLADEVIHFVRYEIPPSVTILNELPRDLHCHLPEKRLRQAILNLVLNSAASMGEGTGSISIGAETDENDLLLCIADDGPGFDEEMLKAGGRPLTSASLDAQHFRLAVARRITRDAGGNMKLSNQAEEEGQHGTRVVLLLPSCVDDG